MGSKNTVRRVFEKSVERYQLGSARHNGVEEN
jgi:hypothetical protein